MSQLAFSQDQDCGLTLRPSCPCVKGGKFPSATIGACKCLLCNVYRLLIGRLDLSEYVRIHIVLSCPHFDLCVGFGTSPLKLILGQEMIRARGCENGAGKLR